MTHPPPPARELLGSRSSVEALVRVIFLSVLPFVIIGCEPEGVDCTSEARASVTVYFTDADGTPVQPATVRYTVDGGTPRDAECVYDGCTQWVAGYEVTGHIEVSAHYEHDVGTCCTEVGDVTGAADVVMDDVGCHVVGQNLTLAFDNITTDCADCG